MSNPLETLSQATTALASETARSVVAIFARPRFPSSGIVWQPGIIVTADHTVRADEDIDILAADGTRFKAQVAGRDAGTDIAVLRAEFESSPPIRRHDGSGLAIGQFVLSVSQTEEDGPALGTGILGTLSNEWRTWKGGTVDRFIRPTIALYPGYSGSPLVAADGRAIGMNSSGLTRQFGVTVPVSTLERVVTQLLERGRVSRAYLGVGLHVVRLPETLRSQHGIEQRSGVVLLSVEPGSPADSSGLLLGDVLLSLNGHTVADGEDVLSALTADTVGKEIAVHFLRGGAAQSVTVKVGERPGTSS